MNIANRAHGLNMLGGFSVSRENAKYIMYHQYILLILIISLNTNTIIIPTKDKNVIVVLMWGIAPMV